MTYSYLTITPAVRRPIIDIIVKSDNYFAIYPMLIDSGADYCILNLELAKSFRIKLSKTAIKFFGIGGEQIIGRWGVIELKIAGHTYKTKVLFADISQFGHGILGQQGFFNHFDIKLSYQKQTIEIEPVKLTN
ncbi:retropepsin-like domain-containing protein [Candidatus Daviesbacteria bacterium]|nr:retropepsin-like domain-containing protein [Candidatus Daviesbacteria bacterium]